MRVILRIARLELASLFYSPIAWLVLIVFAVQFGITFIGKVDMYVSYKELGYDTYNLSDYIFTNGQTPGLFLSVQSQLYLFIPLLTMGLLSRELSSGSIKLLFSSPISVGEIVLGKYLGMMIYGFFLVLILFFYVLAGYFTIESFELTWMLTAILGLYLLLCAYAAIGLFLSSLTSYQVVAAISTLVVLSFLRYVGSVWQDIDFVRHITYFLSVNGKADSLIFGLIRSKDIIYFLVVIVLFLGLTMLRLQAGRESKSAALQTGRYLLLISTCLLIGYVSALPRFTGYIDTTSQNTRTISPVSQDVVSKIDSPLVITTYVNLLDKDYNIGAPEQRNNDLTRFEQYQRFLPSLRMEYVYYYDTVDNSSLFNNKINAGLDLHTVAENVAKSKKVDLAKYLPPDSIRKLIDLQPEGNRFVRKLQIGNRSTYLRLYNDFYKHPGEPNITAAIKTLVSESPKVAFLSGHDQRNIEDGNDRGYQQATSDKTQRNALVNHGFEAVTVSAEETDIPRDISTLVIADPRSSFSAIELERIHSYINSGGNLLITGEVSQQQFLKPILETLGVEFLPGFVVQNNTNVAADITFSSFADHAGLFGAEFEKYNRDTLFKVIMPRAGGLSFREDSGFETVPLLIASPYLAWLKANRLSSDSLHVTFRPEEGDKRMMIPTALALTRQVNGSTQKIAVIADADFISNLELGTFRKVKGKQNSLFYNGLFKWYTNQEYPVEIPAVEPADNDIDLTPSGVNVLKTLFVYVLPGLLLLSGIALLYIRRRK